jgi:hypothetical protein
VTAGWRALCAGAVLGAAVTGGAWAGGEQRPKMRVLKPEADTYVSAAQPDRNFGRALVLRADAAPQATAYLRFRHSSLRAQAAGVTLLVYVRAGDASGFEVRRVPSTDWHEERLTYATAPRPSLQYASSKPGRSRAWSAVDVTPFLSDGEETLTLAITTRSRLGVSFRSRESRQRPVLVVRRGGAAAEEPGGVPESLRE